MAFSLTEKLFGKFSKKNSASSTSSASSFHSASTKVPRGSASTYSYDPEWERSSNEARDRWKERTMMMRLEYPYSRGPVCDPSHSWA